MSTLKVDNLLNSAGNESPISVPGAAKAWVNFNGTGTVAIRDSFNVSSITDDDVGRYTINFTNNFDDSNYCPVMYNNATTSEVYTSFNNQYLGGMTLNASNLKVSSFHTAFADSAHFFVVVFAN